MILGKGEVKLREELEILRKAGYDDALSYETEGWEEPEESQKMIVQSFTWTKNLLKEMGINFE